MEWDPSSCEVGCTDEAGQPAPELQPALAGLYANRQQRDPDEQREDHANIDDRAGHIDRNWAAFGNPVTHYKRLIVPIIPGRKNQS